MANSRPLLERLLNTPNLEKIVPRLQPQVLHRVIERCGLEDSAELVALATPEQLARVLDVDIWRAPAPGADEAFDADRFGLWIAVLMQAGETVAAEKLLGLDIDLVIAGLARHASVFDAAAVSSYTTLDGQHVPGRVMSGTVSEVRGYVLEARRTTAWESIVDLLEHLAAEHPVYFHRLMRGCVRLSSGRPEADGFHNLLEDDEQDMFELETDRESRREREGYVPPAQAQAFLRGARALRFDGDPPPRSPIAGAYFRAIDATPPADADVNPEARDEESSVGATTASDADVNAVAGVFEILRDEGVLTPPPRALLGAGERAGSRLASIEAFVADHPASADELAYLANVLLSGCSIQERSFTTQEASDAAVAICNLGLESWPSQWPAVDLVSAFQVGWARLYRDVCVHAAEYLITVLATIQRTDREIQLRLDGLRHELVRHARAGEPWRARTNLDVLIQLDVVAWAVMLGLIDECPAMHAALRASRQRVLSISPTDFEFIADNSQLSTIREFLASLPSLLTL